MKYFWGFEKFYLEIRGDTKKLSDFWGDVKFPVNI